MADKKNVTIIAGLIIVVLIMTIVRGPFWFACAQADNYVGSEQCRQCHTEEYKAWKGSDHDWAMKPATPEFVLGDFSNVVFDHYGEKSRFFSRDGKYFIATSNAKGEEETFEVAYTFGFYPLQQYLIATTGGRYQAFTVSWDNRPQAQGGQRWFHLYPDEATPPGDMLHWSGTYFTWNSRCADCHSTHLQKNYSAETDRYATTWSEINVACEACHGPGQGHLDWVAQAKPGAKAAADTAAGFALRLAPAAQWRYEQNSPTATSNRSEPHNFSGQLAVCGGCHSRRSPLSDAPASGSLEQNYHLQLLETPLYYADGQIRDEVYVLGSFMQSKMFQHGVECSNCHNPHSLELKLPGNQVCAQCHKPVVFDTPTHHHHQIGSAGAQCVNCHMPATTYMRIDPRRDHSLRIPRPDLSRRFGLPNACNGCHSERTPAWAAQAMADWLAPSGKGLSPHFSESLALGLSRESGAQNALTELAASKRAPGIVQASSLAALANTPGPRSLAVARRQLQSVNALVRAAAVKLFAAVPLAQRTSVLLPLLQDDNRLVRIEVARQLTGIDVSTLSADQRVRWQTVKKDYLESLAYHADTPGGQVNIALHHASEGRLAEAEQAYRRALAQDTHHLGAYLNLADLYRQQGAEEKGAAILNLGMARLPAAAPLYHAAGLLQVRKKDYRTAETLLAKAATLDPDEPRYGYAYGLILQHLGRLPRALAAWERSLSVAPDNRELLVALLNACQQQRQWSKALDYARRLQALVPGDQQIAQLIEALQMADSLK